jgi:hypothetical protein
LIFADENRVVELAKIACLLSINHYYMRLFWVVSSVGRAVGF